MFLLWNWSPSWLPESTNRLLMFAARHTGDLKAAAAKVGDQCQCASQRIGGHTFSSVLLVYEEAGDSPLRAFGNGKFVSAPVLDARQFVCLSELAPTDAPISIKDQRCVCRTLPDVALLSRTPLRAALLAVDMKLHAPASAPNATVLFDECGIGWPGIKRKRFDAERHAVCVCCEADR